MNSSCENRLDGFGFTPDEIAECVARQGLLSMELELSHACNFRCPYCYVVTNHCAPSLAIEEVKDVVRQAKALGARRFILLGGEPMLYPKLRELIDDLCDLGLEIEIFTNGTKIDEEFARYLFERGVMVVLKFNTFNVQLQNQLAGCENGYDTIHDALANLRRAGYPSQKSRMALSTVISQDNIAELPQLWRWIRSQGILPYVEMTTPQGGAAKDMATYCVNHDRMESLFNELSRIDREEFGREWDPQPPLVGNTCKRHHFSCVVTARGDVYPCVGVPLPLGNIRQERLARILRDSEVLENLRDYRSKIKQPCRDCDKAADCYGCRGAAYQLTGDYLAADPLCWRAKDADIDKLPMPAAPLLIHGESVRMVDCLLKVGERVIETELTVRADSLFVGDDGLLDETAYVEIIAQSFAAAHGFHLTPDELRDFKGFLAGVKGLTVHRQACVGDRLITQVNKLVRMGEFAVAEGIVRDQHGNAVAEATVKVWQACSEVPATAGAVS